MNADIPALTLGECDKGGLFLELGSVAESSERARSVSGVLVSDQMIVEREEREEGKGAYSSPERGRLLLPHRYLWRVFSSAPSPA